MLKPQRGSIADLSINSLHCSLLKRNNTNIVNIQLLLVYFLYIRLLVLGWQNVGACLSFN